MGFGPIKLFEIAKVILGLHHCCSLDKNGKLPTEAIIVGIIVAHA